MPTRREARGREFRDIALSQLHRRLTRLNKLALPMLKNFGRIQTKIPCYVQISVATAVPRKEQDAHADPT